MESGTLSYSNADGVTITVNFSEIENIVGAPNYTVDGTDGADLIDSGYTDDPEGDKIDAGDGNPLTPNVGDNDSIIAGAGDDTILAGSGDDTIWGGDGNDYIEGDGGTPVGASTSAGTDFASIYGFDAFTVTQDDLSNIAIRTDRNGYSVDNEGTVSAYTTAFRLSGSADFNLQGQTLTHAGWISVTDAGSKLDNAPNEGDGTTQKILVNGEQYTVVTNGLYAHSYYNNYSFVAGDGKTYTVNDIKTWAENSGLNTTGTSNIFLSVAVNEKDPNDYIAYLSANQDSDEALENFLNDHGGLTSITLNNYAGLTSSWKLNSDIDMRLTPSTDGSLDGVVPASENPLIATFAEQGDQLSGWDGTTTDSATLTTTLFSMTGTSNNLSGQTLTATGYGVIEDAGPIFDNTLGLANENFTGQFTLNGDLYNLVNSGARAEYVYNNFSLQMGDGKTYTYAEYQAWVDANLSTQYDDRLSFFVGQSVNDPSQYVAIMSPNDTAASDYCLAQFAKAHGGLVSVDNPSVAGYGDGVVMTRDSYGVVEIAGMPSPTDATLVPGNDLLMGGAGDDTILGNGGSDTIVFQDGFGNDSIIGGEDDGNTDVDLVDLTGLTTGASVDLSANGADDVESGTVTVGTDVATFAEIEEIAFTDNGDTVTGSDGNDTLTLGAGDDIIDAGLGDDRLNLGAGADTVTGGKGDDSINLGDQDGDADVVVLANGDGNDTLAGVDGPIDLGNGDYQGIDTLDVSNLTNPTTDIPVTSQDVIITTDPAKGITLTFPDGTSITLTDMQAPSTDPTITQRKIG